MGILITSTRKRTPQVTETSTFCLLLDQKCS